MRSIELFSGAGGLALGLEAAGFEHVGLIERNRHACDSLRLNRPHWNVIDSDVREIDFSEFGEVDLVAGGPPCQPFSMGGKAKGYDDSRDMFPEAIRAVRQLRPKAFLFENVRGLLRNAFQSYVEFIRLQLEYPTFPVSKNVSWEVNLQRLQQHHTTKRAQGELCYHVSIQLANAADYGVPQHRHRVFFVGVRSDINAEWFFPSPTHSGDALFRSQWVDEDYWREVGVKAPSINSLRESDQRKIARLTAETPMLLPLDVSLKQELPWMTVRQALSGLPPATGKHSILNHKAQPGAKAYPGHTGSPIDEPAKALKAGDHGVPGGENMLRNRNGSVRYFTIREAARIQTFPDDFEFSGSWSESMRQLGNAVPVRLAHCVGESIADKLRVHGTLSRTV